MRPIFPKHISFPEFMMVCVCVCVYVYKSFRIAAHITTVIHIYLEAPLFIYSLSEPNRNPQPNKKQFVLDCEIVYILLIIE